MGYGSISRARLVAFLLPLVLLAGALGSQYLGGLFPCEMCHWQRWPHYAALVIAGLAFILPGERLRRALVLLAAIAIAISGMIGMYHVGVEHHWWGGPEACTSTIRMGAMTAAERLAAIMKAPVVRCDVPQWSMFGITMAALNAFFSLAGAAIIVGLLRRAR